MPGGRPKKVFLPYADAQQVVATYALATQDAWENWSLNTRKHDGWEDAVPAAPNQYYEGRGWSTWDAWFGRCVVGVSLFPLPILSHLPAVVAWHNCQLAFGFAPFCTAS